MKYQVTLASVGNPDFRQYAPVSEKQVVEADTLAGIQRAARKYIEFWNLGGGNWRMTPIRSEGKTIGYISYNGRIWTSRSLKAQEIVVLA